MRRRLSADVQLRNIDDDTQIAQIILHSMPLRTMFKTKDLYINYALITTSTTNDHYTSYIRWLTTEVYDEIKHSAKISGMIPDTSGQFDSIAGMGDNNNVVNHGARARQRLYNNVAVVRLIDTLDTICFNENGKDRYMPSDFSTRLELTRNPNTKILFGTAALGGNTNVHISNFELRIPLFKPTSQILAAINKIMTIDNEETRYYSTYYRVVTCPLAIGTQRIQENDIFNGSLPTRLYTMMMTQARYNGAYILIFLKTEYMSVLKNPRGKLLIFIAVLLINQYTLDL